MFMNTKSTRTSFNFRICFVLKLTPIASDICWHLLVDKKKKKTGHSQPLHVYKLSWFNYVFRTTQKWTHTAGKHPNGIFSCLFLNCRLTTHNYIPSQNERFLVKVPFVKAHCNSISDLSWFFSSRCSSLECWAFVWSPVKATAGGMATSPYTPETPSAKTSIFCFLIIVQKYRSIKVLP